MWKAVNNLDKGKDVAGSTDFQRTSLHMMTFLTKDTNKGSSHSIDLKFYEGDQ